MPRSNHYFPVFITFLAFLWLAPLSSGSAQVVSAQQLEMLRQNPDLIRQRVRASGLSDNEIRQQMSAAGYSPGLLDAYLDDTSPLTASSDALSVEVLSALEVLGIGDVLTAATGEVPRSVGLQISDTAEVDSAVIEAPLFGLDIFQRGTLFQPTLNGPVPPSYRLGPGDELVLILTGDVELARSLIVTREGFVVIPQVGQVSVTNLTIDQFRSVLRDRLSRSYSGIRDGTTAFDITVSRVRMIQVFVTGEVQQPSAYVMASVATVLNALYAAGGPTENANFRSIRVRRGGVDLAEFDLYDYLLQGSTGGDVTLQDGDVVFAPIHGTRARIVGAVVRPGVYELAEGESLRNLVGAAGGFTADASRRRLAISRIVPPTERGMSGPDRIEIDVALAGSTGEVPELTLQPGDEIRALYVSEAARGFVNVDGAVYEPGRFGWRTGMRLRDVIALTGGFQPAVFTDRAHISRLNPRDSTRYLLSVELPPDSDQVWPANPEIEEYDIITVYARPEFRAPRYVEIGGMVNFPGVYEFNEDMTLRDLILQARGLMDGAYLDTAEVARLPRDRRGGRLAVRYRVPMDSTYLFESPDSEYRRLPNISTAPSSGMADFELEPFDQVSILRQPDFEFLRPVVVTGEVGFPGPYALESKDETLSDLVSRAGGVLPTAFLEGARFYRELDSAGAVNIELERALREPRGRADIVLQPGDSVHVPEYLPTVRVLGAVLAPVSVLFREGANLGYYIENAGGYISDADQKRVSIEYANGSRRTRSGKFLFFGGSYPRPGPGSTVTVPLKDPEDRFDVRGLVSDLVSIIGSITTVIIVANR